jgi:hypothetical protein
MISNDDIVDDRYLPKPFLDRNTGIVREHLVKQMHASLQIGADLIDKEMNGLAFLLKPIVKGFYSILVKKDLEKGTRRSIEGTLRLATEMLAEEINDESDEFNKRLAAEFPNYLKNDQTGRQCKKKHKNFPRLAENLKTTFEWQIRPTMKLLSCAEPGITNYPDLCRAAFPKVDDCKGPLKLQIDAMRYGLKVIKEDLSILDIPTARDLIFRVLLRGFKRKTQDFFDEADEIYS